MNYEKAYKELRMEVMGTLSGTKIFLETNPDFKELNTYKGAEAQVEILEKLEAIILKNEEHEG